MKIFQILTRLSITFGFTMAILFIHNCTSVSFPSSAMTVTVSNPKIVPDVLTGELANGSFFTKIDITIEDKQDNGSSVDTGNSSYKIEIQDGRQKYPLDIIQTASISPGGDLSHDVANLRFKLDTVPATDIPSAGYTVTVDASSYGSMSFLGGIGARSLFTAPTTTAATVTGVTAGSDTIYKISWSPALGDPQQNTTLEIKITGKDGSGSSQDTGWRKANDGGVFYQSKSYLTSKSITDLSSVLIELRRKYTIKLYPSDSFALQIGEMNLEYKTSIKNVVFN